MASSSLASVQELIWATECPAPARVGDGAVLALTSWFRVVWLGASGPGPAGPPSLGVLLRMVYWGLPWEGPEGTAGWRRGA